MEKRIRVSLGEGLDPSEIARFVQVANQYKSKIYIDMGDNRRVNAKSIMGMMSFLSEDGKEVVIKAEGADDVKAAEAIAACLTGKE